MSFFRRNADKPLIPPVESANPRPPISNSTSPRPAPRVSNANTYVASRDGDPYATSRYNNQKNDSYDTYQYDDSVRDKYHRSNGVGDAYSRGGGNAELERDRNELFSGYNPQRSAGSGRFFDGPQLGREPAPGEENDEDVEGIKQQTRFVKQESVNSTRNALRMAREAEETARNTLGRLGDQSERLANTERHLDVSKGHSQRADDKTDELKQLNRSIFRPVIVFNKDAKRAAREAKVQERYEEERQERERAMMDVRETQNRLGRAQTYGMDGEEEGSGRFRSPQYQAARKEQRKRYQFEATASDDELEDELDDNLNEISEVTKKLKALGTAMGQELDSQNQRIDNIEQKTVSLDNRLFRNTERLKKIK
ncbi:protein transport protein sec9 [Moniliophthora roreri MCA 2997]|uniref:Protein transport protein sec9 n=1 Tax=Moniliophthora roreri (strain MCA 2997) TaxID=1381753 RepID=V2X525_MONRO|nr:protein transport protein sec9 [Moniliophthora roreri MCA 2997]